MYTRCPACDTVYRVTGEDLRQADGQVECGSCGEHFNALYTLSERPPAPGGRGGAAVAAEDIAATPVAEDGEAVTDQDPAVAGEEAVPGEVPATIDGPPADGEEDVTLPEDEADRLAPGEDEPTIVEGGWEDRFEDTRTDIWNTGEWRAATPAVFPVLEEAEEPGWASGLASLPGAQAPADADGEEAAGTLPEPVAGPAPEELVPHRRRHWPAWLFVAALALVTALALIHFRRGVLARDPDMARLLAPAYAALGMDLRPTWSVSEFRVLDSAVNMTADGLAVHVAFVNEAGYPQPYPVLRVTLQDRWNQPLATEDLAPRDYLTGFVGGSPMGPGEEARGRALLRPPPSEAVGFSVDLCLEGPDGALRCRSAGE